MRAKQSLTVAVILSSLVGPPAHSSEKIDFNRDIRPILSDRCFPCHGPDEEAREAELRLDVADDQAGPFGDRDGSTPIRAGDLSGSELWNRIISEDSEEVMPPADSHVEALTEAQKELIKRWILEGAEYLDFWSFVPPQSQAVPQVRNRYWNST